MVQPVYNKETKRFEFPKPEPGEKKQSTRAKKDTAMIEIPNSLYDRIITAVKEDGGDWSKKKQDGTTDNDPHNWQGRQYVKLYAIQFLTDALDARAPAKAK